jgi:hypothetical protein
LINARLKEKTLRTEVCADWEKVSSLGMLSSPQKF